MHIHNKITSQDAIRISVGILLGTSVCSFAELVIRLENAEPNVTRLPETINYSSNMPYAPKRLSIPNPCYCDHLGMSRSLDPASCKVLNGYHCDSAHPNRIILKHGACVYVPVKSRLGQTALVHFVCSSTEYITVRSTTLIMQHA